MTTSSGVVVGPGALRAYFREALGDGLDRVAHRPDQATAAYLVDLLCEYADDRGRRPPPASPLGLVVARAMQDDPARSVPDLRRAGDHSLYVAGFQSELLRRSQIDTGYYVLVGGSAYRKLSRLLSLGRSEPSRFVVVFSELGNQFSRFVAALRLIKEGTAP